MVALPSFICACAVRCPLSAVVMVRRYGSASSASERTFCDVRSSSCPTNLAFTIKISFKVLMVPFIRDETTASCSRKGAANSALLCKPHEHLIAVCERICRFSQCGHEAWIVELAQIRGKLPCVIVRAAWVMFMSISHLHFLHGVLDVNG